MDDDKDNQDLVVDKEGSMNQGVNIKVTSDNGSSSEPEINDIQAPPEPIVENTSDDESVDAPIVESTDSETTTTPVESEAISSDSDPVVAESPIPEEPATSDPLATATTLNPSTPAVAQGMSNNEQSQPKEHRNNKKLALIVTILIAVLLAGVAVYMFVSAEDNAEEALTSEQTEQVQEDAVAPATAEDIDQAVTEIDETVQSIDDTTELSEDAVSDTNLGL